MSRRVLFTDFDGTVTDIEFYEFAMTRLDSALSEDPLAERAAGRLSVFEVQRKIFGAIRMAEEEVIALLPELQPDPCLAEDFDRLATAGWELHVVSAGSSWYIERLFEAIDVRAPVSIHANPGRFIAGRGLVLSLPEDERVVDSDAGIDKAEVMRIHAEGAGCIAFAGNSHVDLTGARLATDGYCFARPPLDQLLINEGRSFHLVERFHDIANALLES
jgi:2-hydroxy-3-keto-5-methylthiopentenyl-1-phosphate phosphatase